MSKFFKLFLVVIAVAVAVLGTLAFMNSTLRPVAQVLPPSGEEIARIRTEHFANIMSRPSSQHVVLPSQEVIMTGTPSRINGCLGQEFLVEVKNDIGADQLDISYLTGTGDGVINKAASCGKESIVKQCIPDLTVKLFATAYYYSKNASENDREEKRVYPEQLKKESENSSYLGLLASNFLIQS